MLKLKGVQTTVAGQCLQGQQLTFCGASLLFLLHVSVILLSGIRLKIANTKGKMLVEETQVQIGKCW